MLTGRRFLGHASAGLLLKPSSCRRNNKANGLAEQVDGSVAGKFATASKARPAQQNSLMLGYPVNLNQPPEEFLAWRRDLAQEGIGALACNNVGNPFQGNSISYNTHDFERKVIRKFGELFAFSANNTWGFLSHSGTDSNMHGMYMGRTLLKGRAGVVPKVYFTREAHYSIQILRDLLGLEAVLVETQADGSLDPEDLKYKLMANPGHPALVVATIGTTFKGAIDKVDPIQEVLHDHESYLHLDAALFGGYLPYTSHAWEVHHQLKSNPTVERYDSIAVSCHKFFAFPVPAGLFITTEKHFNEFSELFSQVHNPEYIQQVPGTISCSRDAVKPAEFYFFSTPAAMARQTEEAHAILNNTEYLLQQLQTDFPQLLAKRANDRSNTVFFRKPSNWIVEKYSLATMQLEENHNKQDYAHVVIMPHVNGDLLTQFLTDLSQDSTML